MVGTKSAEGKETHSNDSETSEYIKQRAEPMNNSDVKKIVDKARSDEIVMYIIEVFHDMAPNDLHLANISAIVEKKILEAHESFISKIINREYFTLALNPKVVEERLLDLMELGMVMMKNSAPNEGSYGEYYGLTKESRQQIESIYNAIHENSIKLRE